MTDTADAPADWRRMLAALANDAARRVFANLTLGLPPEDGLAPKAAARALAALDQAGLLCHDPQPRLDPSALKRALASQERPRRTGLERYFDETGRLERIPTEPTERNAVADRITAEAFDQDRDYDEREVTEALGVRFADPVLLRRTLVDLGCLERSRDGSSYRVGGRHVA